MRRIYSSAYYIVPACAECAALVAEGAVNVWLRCTEASDIICAWRQGVKSLNCQRALEQAALYYSLACLNQHTVLCLRALCTTLRAVVYLLSLILLSLWIVFIVTLRVAVEFMGGPSVTDDSTSSVIRVFAAGDIYRRRVNDSDRLRRHHLDRLMPDLRLRRWWPCRQTFQPAQIILDFQSSHSQWLGWLHWQLHLLNWFVSTLQRTCSSVWTSSGLWESRF